MDDLPIGRRVAYWRQRRKMSQQVFADRIGKSKSWVDKVERGARRLDKFSVLYEIADVLQVDVQLLLGRWPHRRPESLNCIDQVEVEEIRSALECYDRIGTFFDPSPVQPAPLEELSKAVKHAWMTFHYAKYGVLARTLPRLIREAQAADAAYRNSKENKDTKRAASLLAQVYQISASVLRKVGEFELGWLAADRAIAVSQRAEDQLLAGVATYRVANALLSLGRSRPALELNVTVAGKLGMGDTTDPAKISVYGILLLQGTMAAARAGDVRTHQRVDPPGCRDGGAGGGAPRCRGTPKHRPVSPGWSNPRTARQPLPGCGPRVRADRGDDLRQRDAAGGRPVGAVGDPVSPYSSRGHHRSTQPIPGYPTVTVAGVG